MKLRWKLYPPETGLRRIGAGPRSSVYHDGSNDYASVHAHSFRHTGKTGWYWVATGDVPYRNTCNDKPLTEEMAKVEAAAYVKQHLEALK